MFPQLICTNLATWRTDPLCGQSSPSPDNWYFVNAQEQAIGPFPAHQILSLTNGTPCLVWKDGLPDWVSSQDSAEFLQALRTPPPLPPKEARRKRGKNRSLSDLLKVCEDILADGIVTAQEVVYLSKWLEEAGQLRDWPWTEIAETVERTMADGVVTDAEREELKALLQRVEAAFQE